jgi:hypothetical protein
MPSVQALAAKVRSSCVIKTQPFFGGRFDEARVDDSNIKESLLHFATARHVQQPNKLLVNSPLR